MTETLVRENEDGVAEALLKMADKYRTTVNADSLAALLDEMADWPVAVALAVIGRAPRHSDFYPSPKKLWDVRTVIDSERAPVGTTVDLPASPVPPPPGLLAEMSGSLRRVDVETGEVTEHPDDPADRLSAYERDMVARWLAEEARDRPHRPGCPQCAAEPRHIYPSDIPNPRTAFYCWWCRTHFAQYADAPPASAREAAERDKLARRRRVLSEVRNDLIARALGQGVEADPRLIPA